ncbi:hypothetical protein Bbelb_067560 [Branchiostoma belcheri]|nr:hypothetical protein Bbelb_067560 [Branchiostoma belcheri]
MNIRWLLTDGDSCLNLTRRLDQIRPGDLKTPDEYQRRLDQIRPGDLKAPEEYQVAADWCSSDVCCLKLTRIGPGDLKTPDEYQLSTFGCWARPANLKTKEQDTESTETCDDVHQLLYKPDQMKALKDINMYSKGEAIGRHPQSALPRLWLDKLPDDPVLTGRNLSKPDEMSVCSCPDWEKPVMMENQTKPDKSWRAQQTRRHSEVKNVNSEDRNEQEEQADFYRPSCVKEDGEV